MIYNPHEYQRYATDFIINNPVSGIFLDLGLGKTVIVLTAINTLIYDSFSVSKVLVIAPLRVARNTWPTEIDKWEHLHNLRYSLLVGNESERKAALDKKADIYIINRENVSWLIENSGYEFDFDMVVIDELSSFKSRQAKRFRSLLKVRPKVHRIVGLTGTPAPNGLMDLWAEFRILDMGKRLGRFISNYRDEYFVPDRRNANVVFSYKPKPYSEERIYEAVSDITISMKCTDYLKMPDCIFNEVSVTLSAEEKKKYDTLKKELVLSIDDKTVTAENAAALGNKLLQMANGAVYDEMRLCNEIHNNKLDALEDLIEAANGKPVLVAYWFKHDLTRITERLHKIGVDFQNISSPQSIQNWNDGKTQVGLIHPASAGHGLNLQSGGSTLIWFGLTWSLELYQQTNGRLWRQGQKETVIIHHIVCKNTIDENVLTALKNKEYTQDKLIEAVSAELKGE